MEFTTHKPSIRYEIQESLGKGSHAQVYRALRIDAALRLQQVVALKILNSVELVEVWKAEFHSLSKVKSKYCVQVFGFESWNGHPALVLEFVEGFNLEHLQDAVLSEAEITEILRQIQCGLQDLKASGLFHGDLSLKNVMVDRSGAVRLLDFGLANRGTRVSTTLDFAAPEVFYGTLTPWQSDLYSLARMEQVLRQQASSPQRLLLVDNLAAEPAQRSPVEILENKGAQSSLALKIEHRLQQQRILSPTSNTVELREDRRSHLRVAAYAFVLFFFCTIVPQSGAMRGATSHLNSQTSATLAVRTQKWVRIEVNGVDLGYGPLTVRLPVGSIQVRWKSAKAHGQRALTLSEGQNTVLDDAFFK